MKAIILAAGVGNRLSPITKEKPKTLVHVNRKPILGYILDSLLQTGIRDVILCTGFKADQIIHYCRSCFPEIRFVFVHNPDYASTNNMYSLYLAKLHLNDDVLLMNADLVFDPQIIVGMAQQSGSCVAVEKGLYNQESMKISIDRSTRIRAISKTIPKDEAYGCSIDVYRLTKSDTPLLLEEMETIITERGDRNQWTEVLLDNLFRSERLKAYPYEIKPKHWSEIDDFEDLAHAEMLFNEHITSLKAKKVFFVDRDGTLLLDNHAIDGGNEFLQILRRMGKQVFILTNNSSKSPYAHIDDLVRAGLKVQPAELLSSLESSLVFLSDNGYKKMYWMATSDVSSYITAKGFVSDEVDPEALLLTYDTEYNYSKLKTFITFLRRPIPYFATHVDLLFPAKDGPLPDIGCMIDIIAKSSGRLPDRTFGKPSLDMILPTLERMDAQLSSAVVIGDRLYTDIAMAAGNDLLSVLVLSGETKRSDYEFSKTDADIVVPSIRDLIRMFLE